jgi:hypothetical protein
MTHSLPSANSQTVYFTSASIAGAVTRLAEEYCEGKCFSHGEVNSALKLLCLHCVHFWMLFIK